MLDSGKGRELGQRDGAGGLLAQPAGQAHHGQPKLAGKAAILLAAILLSGRTDRWLHANHICTNSFALLNIPGWVLD
jgi:hypothetical protein